MQHMHTHNTLPPSRKFSDFLPLVIIFLIIITFTIAAVVWSGRSDAVFAMRMFMGGFFIIFGGFKVSRWKGFVDAFSMYDFVATRSRVYGYLYPLFELFLGVAFLTGWWLVPVSIVTVVLMLVSAIGVLNQLRKREQIVCACLGTVFKIPMTYVTLGEDVLMAAMAGLLVVMVY